MAKKGSRGPMQWRTIDLHIHTPASSDYQEPEVTFMDLLKQAELRGLEIIAFTDHNTIAGYKELKEEIHQLDVLASLGRLLPEEEARLKEYRRLMDKILVLPGIEFTATFGFHILGIFPPDKQIREIEYLLLELNIPPDQLDEGSATVGATTDVLSAYRLINLAGGLVIAAHANSTNGVAMRGFGFGGQTKIAYTQDPYLHALEVTDLEQKGRRTTAGFFNGTKPEYPRRMHCIQGSDSHRLAQDPNRKKNLGIGDRATDVLLPEMTFQALMDLFQSNDFARSRPRRKKEEPVFDFIQAAQEEGSSLVQDFHESMTVRGGRLYTIIADVCAFANTNGGALYIGLSSDPRKQVAGVNNPESAKDALEKEISNRISPHLNCTVDIHTTKGKKVLRVLIPRGEDPPYVVDDYKIYIRSETETGLAVRDEIVDLVVRGDRERQRVEPQVAAEGEKIPETLPAETPETPLETAPRTGVEIVSMVERNGAKYFTLRDLRNGNVVNNVTLKSARRLWHYAITEFSKLPEDTSSASIHWEGDLGVLRRYKQGKRERFDLIQRTSEGQRYFYGVTEDGIHGPWKDLLGTEE